MTPIQSHDVDCKHTGIYLSDKTPQKANFLIEDKLEVNPEKLKFNLQALHNPQM